MELTYETGMDGAKPGNTHLPSAARGFIDLRRISEGDADVIPELVEGRGAITFA